VEKSAQRFSWSNVQPKAWETSRLGSGRYDVFNFIWIDQQLQQSSIALFVPSLPGLDHRSQLRCSGFAFFGTA